MRTSFGTLAGYVLLSCLMVLAVAGTIALVRVML